MNIQAGAVSAGALVLLESRTASGSATLDFTTRNVSGQSGNTFQSDYDTYQIRVVNAVPASSSDLQMLVSADNGSTWASANYNYTIRYLNQNNASSTSVSTGTSQFFLFSTAQSTSGLVATIDVFSPLASVTKQMIVAGTTINTDHPYQFQGQLLYNNTAVVNAVRFKFASGNIASGTIRVYGVAK